MIHLEKGIEINEYDPLLYHLLGIWHLKVIKRSIFQTIQQLFYFVYIRGSLEAAKDSFLKAAIILPAWKENSRYLLEAYSLEMDLLDICPQINSDIKNINSENPILFNKLLTGVCSDSSSPSTKSSKHAQMSNNHYNLDIKILNNLMEDIQKPCLKIDRLAQQDLFKKLYKCFKRHFWNFSLESSSLQTTSCSEVSSQSSVQVHTSSKTKKTYRSRNIRSNKSNQISSSSKISSYNNEVNTPITFTPLREKAKLDFVVQPSYSVPNFKITRFDFDKPGKQSKTMQEENVKLEVDVSQCNYSSYFQTLASTANFSTTKHEASRTFSQTSKTSIEKHSHQPGSRLDMFSSLSPSTSSKVKPKFTHKNKSSNVVPLQVTKLPIRGANKNSISTETRYKNFNKSKNEDIQLSSHPTKNQSIPSTNIPCNASCCSFCQSHIMGSLYSSHSLETTQIRTLDDYNSKEINNNHLSTDSSGNEITKSSIFSQHSNDNNTEYIIAINSNGLLPECDVSQKNKTIENPFENNVHREKFIRSDLFGPPIVYDQNVSFIYKSNAPNNNSLDSFNSGNDFNGNRVQALDDTNNNSLTKGYQLSQGNINSNCMQEDKSIIYQKSTKKFKNNDDVSDFDERQICVDELSPDIHNCSLSSQDDAINQTVRKPSKILPTSKNIIHSSEPQKIIHSNETINSKQCEGSILGDIYPYPKTSGISKNNIHSNSKHTLNNTNFYPIDSKQKSHSGVQYSDIQQRPTTTKEFLGVKPIPKPIKAASLNELIVKMQPSVTKLDSNISRGKIHDILPRENKGKKDQNSMSTKETVYNSRTNTYFIPTGSKAHHIKHSGTILITESPLDYNNSEHSTSKYTKSNSSAKSLHQTVNKTFSNQDFITEPDNFQQVQSNRNTLVNQPKIHYQDSNHVADSYNKYTSNEHIINHTGDIPCESSNIQQSKLRTSCLTNKDSSFNANDNTFPSNNKNSNSRLLNPTYNNTVLNQDCIPKENNILEPTEKYINSNGSTSILNKLNPKSSLLNQNITNISNYSCIARDLQIQNRIQSLASEIVSLTSIQQNISPQCSALLSNNTSNITSNNQVFMTPGTDAQLEQNGVSSLCTESLHCTFSSTPSSTDSHLSTLANRNKVATSNKKQQSSLKQNCKLQEEKNILSALEKERVHCIDDSETSCLAGESQSCNSINSHRTSSSLRTKLSSSDRSKSKSNKRWVLSKNKQKKNDSDFCISEQKLKYLLDSVHACKKLLQKSRLKGSSDSVSLSSIENCLLNLQVRNMSDEIKNLSTDSYWSPTSLYSSSSSDKEVKRLKSLSLKSTKLLNEHNHKKKNRTRSHHDYLPNINETNNKMEENIKFGISHKNTDTSSTSTDKNNFKKEIEKPITYFMKCRTNPIELDSKWQSKHISSQIQFNKTNMDRKISPSKSHKLYNKKQLRSSGFMIKKQDFIGQHSSKSDTLLSSTCNQSFPRDVSSANNTSSRSITSGNTKTTSSSTNTDKNNLKENNEKPIREFVKLLTNPIKCESKFQSKQISSQIEFNKTPRDRNNSQSKSDKLHNKKHLNMTSRDNMIKTEEFRSQHCSKSDTLLSSACNELSFGNVTSTNSTSSRSSTSGNQRTFSRNTRGIIKSSSNNSTTSDNLYELIDFENSLTAVSSIEEMNAVHDNAVGYDQNYNTPETVCIDYNYCNHFKKDKLENRGSTVSQTYLISRGNDISDEQMENLNHFQKKIISNNCIEESSPFLSKLLILENIHKNRTKEYDDKKMNELKPLNNAKSSKTKKESNNNKNYNIKIKRSGKERQECDMDTKHKQRSHYLKKQERKSIFPFVSSEQISRSRSGSPNKDKMVQGKFIGNDLIFKMGNKAVDYHKNPSQESKRYDADKDKKSMTNTASQVSHSLQNNIKQSPCHRRSISWHAGEAKWTTYLSENCNKNSSEWNGRGNIKSNILSSKNIENGGLDFSKNKIKLPRSSKPIVQQPKTSVNTIDQPKSSKAEDNKQMSPHTWQILNCLMFPSDRFENSSEYSNKNESVCNPDNGNAYNEHKEYVQTKYEKSSFIQQQSTCKNDLPLHTDVANVRPLTQVSRVIGGQLPHVSTINDRPLSHVSPITPYTINKFIKDTIELYPSITSPFIQNTSAQLKEQNLKEDNTNRGLLADFDLYNKQELYHTVPANAEITQSGFTLHHLSPFTQKELLEIYKRDVHSNSTSISSHVTSDDDSLLRFSLPHLSSLTGSVIKELRHYFDNFPTKDGSTNKMPSDY